VLIDKPAIVIVLIMIKVKAIPAIFVGIMIGGIFAISFQPNIINEVAKSDGNYLKSSYMGVINTMTGDVNFTEENAKINDVFEITEGNRSGLLKSGGM